MSIRDRIQALFSEKTTQVLFGTPTNEALLFVVSNRAPDDEHWVINSPLALHALNELASNGIAQEDSEKFEILWDALYKAMEDPERERALNCLSIPKMGSLRPLLKSANSLEDSNFEIAIDGWLNEDGRINASKLGAIANTDAGLQLLPSASYALTAGVEAFWKNKDRSPESNRYFWGKIRNLAIKANAGLDRFLSETIVLAPDKLQIMLKDTDIVGSSVVEVQPWFVGAPDEWLTQFDIASNVKDRYQIATKNGLVEILVTPEVKSVLKGIKKMPGRRTSGSFAEQFLHNPFATLGPDATQVIDEAQFENARREAGIEFEQFAAKIEMIEGAIKEVGVVIECLSERLGTTKYEKFESSLDLRAFIAQVETKLQTGGQLCEWRKHRLELTGNAISELELLKSAYIEWTAPRVEIKMADVHDLDRYSQRVSGIGIQPRIISPYIPVNSGSDPWFPDSPLDAQSTKFVSVAINAEQTLELLVDSKVYETIRRETLDAEAINASTISIPGHPNAVPILAAKTLVNQLASQFGSLWTAEPPSSVGRSQRPTKSGDQRLELLLRANVSLPEFVEERAKTLYFDSQIKAELPACLRPSVSLKAHQLSGVAWLQNLFEKSPHQCRGAVLADDMGLGKTLQLLTLICRAVEDDPEIDPILVVAPVSLLENWKEEAGKFFTPDQPKILTLYGSALSNLRARRESIEPNLLEQGLTRFLKPNWLGEAKLVLTTYETLRDLEFSFAAIHWSLMICDEAQKIKNPSAMVTRAAKKQNVRFRIACTGTPVENSLADLWCLFDFVQPGLLGALNEFGATYRRPIECETEDQRVRINQLREIIQPQILRRTKMDVAKDLPAKIIVDAARKLELSDFQRSLYSNAIEKFKTRHSPNADGPFKNHLGLLHYLRRLCIAPSQSRSSGLEPLASYRKQNPKIDWLIGLLKKIEFEREKAIVFCEFRDIQLLLAKYIEDEFRFRPDIINGDTEASATSADSRQKRITKFQNRPGFGAIILSPIAVGYGVNIQAANHVIHFSRTWNPAKEDQATDRAFRIGQTRPVYVYYPMVCARDFTTFDVKLDALLERRRSLSGDMLNGCGDLNPAEFMDIVQVDERIFDERITIHDALSLDGIEFEALVAVLWKKRGFKSVELTARTGDGGIDLMARSINKGELVQCKSSRIEGAKLGWDAIKEVVAGEAKYRFNYPGVDFEKVAITNQFFNGAAQMQAELNNVRLLNQTDLTKLLEEHRVVRGDVELMLETRAHFQLDY